MESLSRRQIAGIAVTVAFVVVLAIAAVLGAQTPPVSVASPSPTAPPTLTPTPTPSPSPSPTPSPTAAPTTPAPRTPEPTISYIAGTRMLPYYFEIRPMFAALPPAPVILPDEDVDVG